MLADFIIKPYRQSYDPKENLGPNLFVINKILYERIDYQVIKKIIFQKNKKN
jgi:hypothetical protein